MVSRYRLIAAGFVFFGLILLMIGGAFVNAGHTALVNPTPEQAANYSNYALVWGPTFMDFGLFLVVAGLLFAVVALEDLDVFVRLFLMILAFVAVLLILASPGTFFP